MLKKDLPDILQNSEHKNLRRSFDNAVLKCRQIWAVEKYSKGSEAINELLGKKLPRPVVTRWATMHNCISELLKHKDKLSDLLEMSRSNTKHAREFNDHEVEALEGYLALTKPIAIAIKTLEGDKAVTFGDLLPRLSTTEVRLEQIGLGDGSFNKLAQPMIAKLHKRFSKYLTFGTECTEAACASISNPKYKNKWIKHEHAAKALELFQAVYTRMTEHQVPVELQVPESTFFQETDDESIIMSSTQQAPVSTESEIVRYLKDPETDFKMLERYPCIKKIFYRYNTKLPTSAAAEGMFKFATILANPGRRSILPANFEANVVLKANSCYEDRD